MTDTEKKNSTLYSDIAYDDAFRTLESLCDDIVIPFVNHMFGENYSQRAVITRLRNEHFVEGRGGKGEKRITDSSFVITENNVGKRYHLECESKKYDGSILVRIFEYDARIALENADTEPDKIIVKFPNTGVLMLRSTNRTPDKALIEIKLPNEKQMSYEVPVLKVSDYTIDEIFEKKLYMLIPFYIFVYEKDLESINEDEKKQTELLEVYRKITEKLESELISGNLSGRSLSAIMDTIECVSYKLTMNWDNVQKKVGDYMGGKIIELESVKKYDEFIENTIKNRDKEKIAVLLRKGKSVEEIVDLCEYPEDLVREVEQSLLVTQ